MNRLVHKPPEKQLQQSDWVTDWRAMQRACRRIVDYVGDRSAEEFRDDPRTCDAVIRNLEIVSSAATTIPQLARDHVDEARWRRARKFRAAAADVDEEDGLRRLWELATREVPDLLDALQAVDVESLDNQHADHAQRMGRRARWPPEIPWRGWRHIAVRLWREMIADHVFIATAGVAFYGLLAVFPALAVLVSAYGLLFDPSDIHEQIEALALVLPLETREILTSQLSEIAQDTDLTLTLRAVVGATITLWSARAGAGALMVAMNIVYGETEKRSMLHWYALSLLFTLGAIVYGVFALALVVALPAALGALGLDGESWVALLRWPLLAISTVLVLSVIYRYGPSRRPARWHWVTSGALVATALWILGSVLFSMYVSNFDNLDRTYGSVGAVVILMMWFYLSALVVLLGAELDAVSEQHTSVDSTVGPPRPMGQRGAYVADTLDPGH